MTPQNCQYHTKLNICDNADEMRIVSCQFVQLVFRFSIMHPALRIDVALWAFTSTQVKFSCFVFLHWFIMQYIYFIKLQEKEFTDYFSIQHFKNKKIYLFQIIRTLLLKLRAVTLVALCSHNTSGQFITLVHFNQYYSLHIICFLFTTMKQTVLIMDNVMDCNVDWIM